MKIYVVIEVWYSNTDLVACFRRKEEAEKFISKLATKWTKIGIEIRNWKNEYNLIEVCKGKKWLDYTV